MGQAVVSTANLQCSFGMAPAALSSASNVPTVQIEGKPAANISCMAPAMNIPPFGMCNSLSNPTVAAATSAALGVLTPMPCVPVTAAPWTPMSPTVTIAGQPALVSGTICNCAWGGVIQVAFAGSTKTTIG